MAANISYEVNLGELEIAICERNLCKDELLKMENSLLGGLKLKAELEDASKPDVDKSVTINLKSHGIYLQFDRALAKNEKKKEQTFMVRAAIWGGGDISPDQWLKFDKLAEKYSSYDDGSPSLRLTTRQAIQFHRVKKVNLIPLIHGLIESGRSSLNGCGDNSRNPTAPVIKSEIFDANALAQKVGEYFQLDLSEYYSAFNYTGKVDQTNKRFMYDRRGLPRKLKIGIGGYYIDQNTGDEIRDNSVDVLTNDIGIVPIVENKIVTGYQVYIGGGLGQKNRKATFALLGGAFGIFKSEDELIKGLDSIVHVQQQVGDRQNRHWARLKNVLIKKGLENSSHSIEEVIIDEKIKNKVRDFGIKWYQEQVIKLGVSFAKPINMTLGSKIRTYGWIKQYDKLYSHLIYIENGRISDTNPQGRLKSLVKEVVKNIDTKIRIAPSQDLFFLDIKEAEKEKFEKILIKYGYGEYSKLRKNSEACVGLNTCPLAVAPSEIYFNELMTDLEERELGNLNSISVGVSGCERHCSRNVTHALSIEGKANDIYQLKIKIDDSDESLAQDIIIDEQKYLRSIPKKDIPDFLASILKGYKENRIDENETIEKYHSRIGFAGLINYLTNENKFETILNKVADPYTA